MAAAAAQQRLPEVHAGLDLNHLDSVPQQTLDGVLWKSVHGPEATPPPPGPNAEPESSNTDPEG